MKGGISRRPVRARSSGNNCGRRGGMDDTTMGPHDALLKNKIEKIRASDILTIFSHY
jgi:hypothetical protein